MFYSRLIFIVLLSIVLLACEAGGEVTTAPTRPAALNGQAGNQQVILEWPAAPGALQYNLYWWTGQPSNGGAKQIIRNVSSPYVHEGRSNSITYYYVVTAVNDAGESSESPMIALTPVAPPAQPILNPPVAGSDSITLSWAPVANADTYTIYAATQPGITPAGIKTRQGWAIVENVASPYDYSGLLADVTYYFAVTASNDGGEGIVSSEISAELLPQPPQMSSVIALDGSVRLEWPEVLGAQSYNLYLASVAGVNPDEILTLPDHEVLQDISSPATVTGLVNGRTYYFVVTAVNTGGESDISAEAEATPESSLPIAAGQDHTCAIDSNYALWCWGRNNEGQLGVGTFGSDFGRTLPTRVGGLNDWNHVATGGFHSCGTRIDGSLWCWGSNYDGEIGDGSFSRAVEPTQVAGNAWSQVALGSFHSCGLNRDGALFCWGYGGNGQLGTGSNSSVNSPTPVQNSDLPWSKVTAGDRHSCGIKANNTLWCWGNGGSGRIGDGFTSNRNTPTFVSGSWIGVAAGGAHSCGIRSDGSLRCWGSNEFGQLGNGISGSGERSLLPDVVASNMAWEDVAAGTNHTCGVKTNGSLWCWGNNVVGQLGQGTAGSQAEVSIPTQVGEEFNWQSVSISTGNHTCAYKSDGSSWCWGKNEWGQLGDGSDGNVANRGDSIPVAVNADSDWEQLSVGGRSSCAIKTGGTLWCWGNNLSGNLGDGTTVNKPVPVQVGEDTWINVAVGLEHACGVKSNNSLWCWGSSGTTQSKLGLGPNGAVQVYVPHLVDAETSWSSVSVSNGHSCAVSEAGAIFCWGDGAAGVLAQGPDDLLDKNIPTPAVTTLTFSSVAAGSDHSCAIGVNGVLWCWGDQYYGETAQGVSGFGEPDLYLPAQVGLASDWLFLQSGSNYSCGIKADTVDASNQLYCWGGNSDAQLGNGATATAVNIPTLVAGDSTAWRSVAVDFAHSCGIKHNDTLWCWGDVSDGQLGIGIDTGAPITTPTQVGAAEWSVVGVGYSHSCAIKTNGTMWCWGDNFYGQLGNGSLWSGDPGQIFFQ